MNAGCRKFPSALTTALLAAALSRAAAQSNTPVTLEDLGRQVRLSNSRITFTVTKADATIRQLSLDHSPNLAGRGAYFAVANSAGHDGWDFHNAEFRVVRQSPDLAEIASTAPIGGVRFTQHYILRREDPGFYVFILAERRAGDPPEHVGQVRWSFYLDPARFNYQLASDDEQGPVPDLKNARTLQDATYELADGSVYTKYNYCVYLEDDWVHGMCGTNTGSQGVFIITPSAEFLQAPTKQEITVHAGPIIHRFLASGHFEPRELSSPAIPDGWTKACGPWFVYVNNGNSPAQIWADAKERAHQERQRWPYDWMRHPAYPLERGSVHGTLKLFDGSQCASNALMILTAPEPDWQLQVLNYIFSTRADAQGRFHIPAVRPGDYTLFAAVPGVTDEFRRDNIRVAAGQELDLGTVLFSPARYPVRLWQIGEADRRTSGFRLADQPRQYGLDRQVPAELVYTVGASSPSNDWYYAQAKPGDWKILFQSQKTHTGEGVFTLGIAGQTRDPELEVRLNGKPIGSYKGGNSSALYRSAVLGSSYYENKIIRFPAGLVQPGTNTLTLRLLRGSVMYDTLKLEIDGSSRD
ncbi:MAG: polysaccharide lyase family protein [Verrucomicrobiota bacterium]